MCDVSTNQINYVLYLADMSLPHLSKKEYDQFRQFWQHHRSAPLLELGERSGLMPFKDDPHKGEWKIPLKPRYSAPPPRLSLGLEAISEDDRRANEVKLTLSKLQNTVNTQFPTLLNLNILANDDSNNIINYIKNKKHYKSYKMYFNLLTNIC